jgi:hypothetical protein
MFSKVGFYNILYHSIPILGDGHQTIFIDDENPGLGGPKSGAAEAQIIGTDHMLDKNNICNIIYIYCIILYYYYIIYIYYIINIYIYYNII